MHMAGTALKSSGTPQPWSWQQQAWSRAALLSPGSPVEPCAWGKMRDEPLHAGYRRLGRQTHCVSPDLHGHPGGPHLLAKGSFAVCAGMALSKTCWELGCSALHTSLHHVKVHGSPLGSQQH